MMLLALLWGDEKGKKWEEQKFSHNQSLSDLHVWVNLTHNAIVLFFLLPHKHAADTALCYPSE
jgi:hypothetical protein